MIGGVVLGLIAVVAGNLLFPETPDPPLLRGLPERHAEASKVLTDRAHARFPAGTSESAVIVELVAQGFKVSPTARDAEWQRKRMPCVEIARIWWRAQQGRVTAIEGWRDGRCP